jgi:predicted XRE-type DNA-binding protein
MADDITDALEIIDRLFGGESFNEAVAEERLKGQISIAIYEARTQAGLTQGQLAERIGTRQPAISRLEDGDYDRCSLTTLYKVAAALGMRVEVRFVPLASSPEAADSDPELLESVAG